jgi:flagellar motility protein MotE (MotC chaperone)
VGEGDGTMKSLWRIYATVIALVATTAAVAGVVFWKLGVIDPVAMAAAAVPAPAAAPPGAPAISEAPPANGAPAPAISEGTPAPSGPEEPRVWDRRVDGLFEELAAKEAAVLKARQDCDRQLAAVKPVAAGLATLLGHLMPPGKAPTQDELLQDPAVAARALEYLQGEALVRDRATRLTATVAEMGEEEAAALLGGNVAVDLAALVLNSLDPETRASIIGKLVRKDPDKAGTIFARLAEEQGRASDKGRESDAHRSNPGDQS